MNFQVLPHPKAPLFANFNDASRIIEQLIDDQLGGHPTRNDEIVTYLRQAGLVNLWFFLKFIAGVAGPFNALNEGVHLELCNFRQSEYCMQPGAHAMAFLPRGFCKTTIMTIGGSAWEAVRDGDIRIRIINSVVDRAHGFKRTAQRIFDSNPLFAVLYPEMVPGNAARRWNDNELVVPHATKFYKEPTIKAGGASGASEGDHHDLLNLDDLIGLDEVDDNFTPNQRMKGVASWLDTNMIALLISPETSRVLGAATRYGRGDVYQQMWDDCKLVLGYPNGVSIKTDPKNRWVIYYRHVVENGVATNPEIMSVDSYEHLLKTKPLVAAYQYANNVDISVTNELAKLPTKRCRVTPTDRQKTDYIIERPDDAINADNPEQPLHLSQCNVAISVDWAGSDKRKSVNTCRTSIGLWAVDAKRRYYRINQRVGYFSLPDVFNHLFDMWSEYRGFIQATLVEGNAMQLGIVQLLEQEQERRGTYLNTVVLNGKSDKVIRIRSTLSTYLYQGMVYLSEGASAEFTEERLSFPDGKLDVLDESEKALSWLEPPEDADNKVRRYERRIYNQAEQDDNLFGY